ncbi:2-hydroxychromene-2-carboxylate isomerase [Ochrobactrum soli]|uniref:2-hydroxychromene-2-carboxylate isomerase n=1 Tax=Ochrobactrum soli TaxID=2448455 RepID=UPI000EF1894B|nr:DsbA family protein [[Ochrobactrum] soli]RLL74380.1 2-hydroxychromene-2-carboxylate isomerase [[Ochrobactrum] soli]
MPKTIDYFFSIGSPWSYLGLDTLEELAEQHVVEIKPYLATVIEENGGILSRNRPEVRRAYGTQDLKRWAKFRGKPLFIDGRPALSDPTPASFSVIAAHLDGQNWLQLTRVFQNAFWSEAKDIGKPEVRSAVADRAGFNGGYLVARENDYDVQAKWKSDREHAVARGVFGFPTYIYDAETYWGQDNLGFLASHLRGETY